MGPKLIFNPGELTEMVVNSLESDKLYVSDILHKSFIDGNNENLSGGPLLFFVNGAWLDQRFLLKSTFQEILKATYKAELKNVDFLTKVEEVVEEVNAWAKIATRGLIKQLSQLDC
ncbi:hypothetical protein FEM48_Zijuj04G0060000 [Ziziphus jujuba var. spinosa]|uniref:Serpin domain-containing protein n=1 Tax=Ziziphus jujuba var. spinosa TaxID=714518 RepID=A0A978VI76_ZIZJJ|nr:hypothetical protein FEM48_Zijuj04G0060000 [Ziziphus jujuba var. spinosa]